MILFLKFLDTTFDITQDEEKQNFVKLSYIILDISAKHLRVLFKRRWDSKHPHQKWSSDGNSGNRLYNALPDGTIRSKSLKLYTEKWRMGNEQEWDTTTLLKLMLDSGLNLIQGLRPESERAVPLRTSEKISIIRNIRNEYFAHLPTMSCPSGKFRSVVNDIRLTAKEAFGLAAEREIGDVVTSPLGKEVTEECEKLLSNIVKDFEENLNGKVSLLNH